jgi:CopA family copper-resistance protein
MCFHVILLTLSCCLATSILAAEKTIDLYVGYKTVNYANKDVEAIAVNQQIPAPTLRFTEGDHVIINVHNKLTEPTTIHWHGIILSWQMDGVEGVSQQGIPPGESFKYEFTLKQAGTYWYHSHAGLQEQQGMYGVIIIDPIQAEAYQYNQDFTVVLSDWSNTVPHQIYRNLKKTGDYYEAKFPLQPSLVKFLCTYCKASCLDRQKILGDYKMMQQMRMSIYDFSDVAYDAYLLNGHTCSNPWQKQVNLGDVVRLRFIGAAAGTIYRVKIPGTEMQMIHVQGNDIKPYFVKDFYIAPGETYDVLLKIQHNQPYIIYAESLDTRGMALGALLTEPQQKVNYCDVKPFPEPLPTSRSMMHTMHDMPNMSTGHVDHKPITNNTMPMTHDNHTVSASSTPVTNGVADHANHNMDMQMIRQSNVTMGVMQYQPMLAAIKTNDPNIPVYETIKMDLNGYMDRFIWFVNGVPFYKAKPIELQPGKRYRFIFNNTSMMQHPMHIHGHWFILRNGAGEYDPLLHTINLTPGATVIADVDTDASGQWFFHCHVLYHMDSGMARVFQYNTLIEIAKGKLPSENIVADGDYINRPIVRVDELLPLNQKLIKDPMPHPAGFYFGNYLDIGADPFHNVQKLDFKGLYGPDYNKLELFINDAEMDAGTVSYADLDIFYWHLIAEFWAVKGGINYFYRPALTPYWQPGIGIEGLMPYFIETDIRVYYKSGCTKFDIEFSRDNQITNNFFLRLGLRSILGTKSVTKAQLGIGLNEMRYSVTPYFRLGPGLSAFFEYEYQRNYGAFNKMQLSQDQATVENTYSFGLAMIF